MLGASAYPCGGFCRVHGPFQVSSWKEREHRCPKRGRLITASRTAEPPSRLVGKAHHGWGESALECQLGSGKVRGDSDEEQNIIFYPILPGGKEE